MEMSFVPHAQIVGGSHTALHAEGQSQKLRFLLRDRMFRIKSVTGGTSGSALRALSGWCWFLTL